MTKSSSASSVSRHHLIRKPVTCSLLLAMLLGLPGPALAETPLAQLTLDGQEAGVIVLYGDMNNLSFGWPEGYDVFSGESTPAHSYPWEPPANATPGTDRIMLGTGYNGHPPNGGDGYSGTSRPQNLPQALDIRYHLQGLKVNAATLQMFVDDFQSPVWKGELQATINGKRAPFLEEVLNSLDQTGPIGKLITLRIPQEFLPDVAAGKFKILIDDPTTGAGDGYAVDFVRLLINPKAGQYKHLGEITGRVTDAQTGKPLSGATVFAAGVEVQTGADGSYGLKHVPAGLAMVTASKDGYTHKTSQVDLIAGKSASLDFALQPGADSGASSIRSR